MRMRGTSTASSRGGTKQLDWHPRDCNYLRMNADNQDRGEDVQLAVEMFAMLADITRVRILLALRDGEHSVGDLAEAVEKSAPAVSQHLAKLRLSRMVLTRHEGTRIFYRLADDHASELIAVAMHQADHVLGIAPPHDALLTHEDAADA